MCVVCGCVVFVYVCVWRVVWCVWCLYMYVCGVCVLCVCGVFVVCDVWVCGVCVWMCVACVVQRAVNCGVRDMVVPLKCSVSK